MKTVNKLNVLRAIVLCLHMFYTEARSLGNGNLVSMAIQYLIGTVKDVPLDILHPPRNEKGSVEYRLYTQRNPKEYCLLEPTKEALKNCHINSQDKLILIVHGFITELAPGNIFEDIKDTLLENGSFNVIILDWTKYNEPPYSPEVENIKAVSVLVTDMLKYLIKYTGVRALNMVIIAHSLGAHLAGYIGRFIPNFGRIDSLDPVWPLFTSLPYESKLTFSDANFVRVMHTSSDNGGLGTVEALGHMDFYVNGGSEQPHCKYGSQFKRTRGDVVIIDNAAMKTVCNHEFAPLYYIETINSTNCRFLATNCDSYQDFNDGKCPPRTSEIGDMGFYGERIIGIPPKSKFFLRTGSNPPNCLNDGFKPLKTETTNNVVLV